MNDIPILGPEDDYQKEAERLFGPDAYVPMSGLEMPDAEVLGYLCVEGEGELRVVRVPNSGRKGMVDIPEGEQKT